MKRFLLLSLVGAVLLNAVPTLADDGFYVIAGRYTPGTKITSLPYEIKTPGYYYLTSNLSHTGGNGITVNADDVTIDLMGFVLTRPNNVGEYKGIYINGHNNVEVRNGTVKGWYVGVQSFGARQRVIGIRASGNYLGVGLTGNDHLIQGCTADGTSAKAYGLAIDGTGTISGCTAANFSSYLLDPWAGHGIILSSGTASNNVVINCGAIGIRGRGPATISHNAVINCTTGISSEGGGSIVGNAVLANPGQTGIAPATNLTPSATPSLLDQNSVTGDGTHYGPGNGATVMGLNSPQYSPP
jgi:hypothetical protein